MTSNVGIPHLIERLDSTGATGGSADICDEFFVAFGEDGEKDGDAVGCAV